MPRYYFRICDHDTDCDEIALDVSSLAEARRHALVASSDMLKDHGLEFWGGGRWQMDVVNDAGTIVLRLAFCAETLCADDDDLATRVVAPTPV